MANESDSTFSTSVNILIIAEITQLEEDSIAVQEESLALSQYLMTNFSLN